MPFKSTQTPDFHSTWTYYKCTSNWSSFPVSKTFNLLDEKLLVWLRQFHVNFPNISVCSTRDDTVVPTLCNQNIHLTIVAVVECNQSSASDRTKWIMYRCLFRHSK